MADPGAVQKAIRPQGVIKLVRPVAQWDQEGKREGGGKAEQKKKHFFSEEKKQKTFTSAQAERSLPRPHRGRAGWAGVKICAWQGMGWVTVVCPGPGRGAELPGGARPRAASVWPAAQSPPAVPANRLEKRFKVTTSQRVATRQRPALSYRASPQTRAPIRPDQDRPEGAAEPPARSAMECPSDRAASRT